MKNIGEFCATALNKLLKMACSILARREMRIGAFRPKKRNTCRMRVSIIQMLLQQRLLSKHGVFNDKLEQTGNVVCVEMVGFYRDG
ncbi:Uncharacterised protein [Salmonella enterica subsp. enterica serovar Madelia]|nr:Uncharacterised protein [Salmonella enterica subsp. enterica serovar Madelia]